MSMTIMLSGSIAKQPETRTSKNGNEYTTATIRAGEGDNTMFASIAAFGDLAPTLAGLAKGDPVTIIGHGKVSIYTPAHGGDPRTNLSVTASRIITLVGCTGPAEAAKLPATGHGQYRPPPQDSPAGSS